VFHVTKADTREWERQPYPQVSASDDKNLHLWDVQPESQYFGQTLRIFAGRVVASPPRVRVTRIVSQTIVVSSVAVLAVTPGCQIGCLDQEEEEEEPAVVN
jgi:hypothetical protein